MRVEESIEIARPRQTVWEFVADASNDPRWCPKVRSVVAAGDRRWKVVHKPVPLRPPVELTVEYIEIEPPYRLRIREEDEASVFEVEYRLDESGAGTRFTQVSDFERKRLPRFLRGTFARGVRGDVRRQLRSLKSTLETRGAGS